jgi:hypothetical protein
VADGVFLYDVAEAIDLATVARSIGATAPARVSSKPAAPPYIQYADPPISIEGSAVGLAEMEGFHVRFKGFDYGVVSVALTRPLPAAWDDLLADGLRWQDDPELTTADDLLTAHGPQVAQLLRGERDEVLRHRISYLATDLVVPAWTAAFIYDTEAGARGVLEILEFANSQLLEFPYYDGLLDAELQRIYAQLQQPRWPESWFGRRFTRAARQVHALFIDVNELTDKTENALKIAGNVYAARLGLDHWKGNVREKLKTLDDIYRFAVERTGMARGELLELVIVLILVLELVLFFAGIMR